MAGQQLTPFLSTVNQIEPLILREHALDNEATSAYG